MNHEEKCGEDRRDDGLTLDEIEMMETEEVCMRLAQYIGATEEDDDDNDDDYIMNHPQWLKTLAVMRYFDAMSGECEPCYVRPSKKHGGVTAYFTLIDLKKEDIQRFCNMLSLADWVSIDATLDGKVCISVAINDVFVRKYGC